MKIIKKLIKFITILIWIITLLPDILITILFLSREMSWSSFFFTPLVTGTFSIITFIIDIPFLCIIFVALYLAKKKWHGSFYYYTLVLALDMLLLSVYAFFTFRCAQSTICQENEAPLGSEQAWITGIFVGHLFWTLPVVKYADKWLFNRTSPSSPTSPKSPSSASPASQVS